MGDSWEIKELKRVIEESNRKIEEARKKYYEEEKRKEELKEQHKANSLQGTFVDDPNKSPNDRVEAFRKYLESIRWQTKGMGTIDQQVANWAMAQGILDQAMGGRRSRKIHITRRAKTKKSYGRKARKTRRYKK